MTGLNYMSGVGNGEQAAVDALRDAIARSDHKDIAFYKSILKTYRPTEFPESKAIIQQESSIDLYNASFPKKEEVGDNTGCAYGCLFGWIIALLINCREPDPNEYHPPRPVDVPQPPPPPPRYTDLAEKYGWDQWRK